MILPRARRGAMTRGVHLRCPICRRERDVPDDSPTRPFCSQRCKTIDLGNWLGEAYRISRPLDEFAIEANDDPQDVN
jgi:uncharacterized protein